MADVDNFLEHYGVKGMKWGVNRSGGSGGARRTNKENRVRANRKDARRRRQTLSDKNLDQLVKRLEQEKKLKSLLDDDLAPGRMATKRILGNVGTKVAGTVLAGASVFVVKAALDGSLAAPFKGSFAVDAAGNTVKKAFNSGAAKNLAKDLAGSIPKLKK